MAISTTQTRVIVVPNSGIKPLAPEPGSAQEQVGPSTGYEAWNMYTTDIGDGGGGNAEAIFQFTNTDGGWYYTLTALFASRQDTGVSTDLKILTPVGDWEAFIGNDGIMAGGVKDELACKDGLAATVNEAGPEGFRPRYLGRAITADSDVRVAFANTSTVVYDIRLAGLRSRRPGIPWYDAIQQAALL